MYKILYLPTNTYIPHTVPRPLKDSPYKDFYFYTEKDAHTYIRRFLRHLHSGPFGSDYIGLISATYYGVNPRNSSRHVNLLDSCRLSGYIYDFLTEKVLNLYLSGQPAGELMKTTTPKKPGNIVHSLLLLMYLENLDVGYLNNCKLPKLHASHFLVVKC